MTAEEIREEDARLGIDSTWYRNGESPYMHLAVTADAPQGGLQHCTEDLEVSTGQDDNQTAIDSGIIGFAEGACEPQEMQINMKRKPLPLEHAEGSASIGSDAVVSPLATECRERPAQLEDDHGPRKRHKRALE